MKRDEFKKYLIEIKKQKSQVADSRVSACQRIDNEYDIDSEYAFDKCKGLVELFTYSKNDEENGALPAHGIAINGSCYNGTATLKASLKLYIEFKEYTSLSNKSGKKVKKTSAAMYCGDYEGFMHFINGYCRNLVNIKTKSEKIKKAGVCEYCKKAVGTLEAAHKFGEERPVIIKKVLDSHFSKGPDNYEVDLVKFEDDFLKAQTPCKDHFYFLCKSCHTKYDSGRINQRNMSSAVGR